MTNEEMKTMKDLKFTYLKFNNHKSHLEAVY